MKPLLTVAAWAALFLMTSITLPASAQDLPGFQRGDCNSDGGRNISDVIFLVQYLFESMPEPGCLDACDMDDTGGLSLTDVIMALSVTSFVFGCAMGEVTDRNGPKRTMIGAALSLSVTLVVVSLFRSPWLVIGAVLVFGAIGITGIWVAGRKLLIELAPADEIGKYFGLYGMTGKLSAIGTLPFAFFADRFGTGDAVLLLLVPIVLGIACLGRVRT